MKKAYKISLIFFTCIGLFMACTKIDYGYLSDYIKYRSPLLVINAGSYSISEALFTDGSTLPLEVELMEIRNKNTGAVATDLLTERELNMWVAPFDYTTDTTEALVLEKLELKAVPAFEINEASGMVRFNPNTAFAEDSLYEFDLRISNVNGTKEYPGIGQVKFIPINPVEYRSGTRIRVVSYTAGVVFQYVEDVQNHYDGTSEIMEIRKISDESAPGVTVHLKTLDKNGNPFNPSKDQVRENWPGYNLPGYESSGSSVRTERTDTEFIYYFPVTPFPYFSWYGNDRWFMYYHILPHDIASIDPDAPFDGAEFRDNFDPTDDHWANFRVNLKIYQAGTWEIIIRFPHLVAASS